MLTGQSRRDGAEDAVDICFKEHVNQPTSAVKFGSIVVSFCAAEMGRTESS